MYFEFDDVRTYGDSPQDPGEAKILLIYVFFSASRLPETRDTTYGYDVRTYVPTYGDSR